MARKHGSIQIHSLSEWAFSIFEAIVLPSALPQLFDRQKHGGGRQGSAGIPEENTFATVIDTLAYSIGKPYNGVQRKKEI